MDFSYYNNNNEKVRLNIEVGSNWDSLNIQNKQLNSIFSKIDDGGDRVVSENDLNLLNRLFKKADGILSKSSENRTQLLNKLSELVENRDCFDYLKFKIQADNLSNEEVYEFLKDPFYKGLLENKELVEILKGKSANGILENEELDEVIKQIDDGRIKLPEQNTDVDNAEFQYREKIAHFPSFTKTEYDAIGNEDTNAEIHQKYIDKTKEYLKKYHNYDTKFPEDKYDVEVVFNGKYYISYVYDKEVKTMFQSLNIIRADGIELGFKDNYNADITDDENIDYSKIHQSASWGTFSITDKNGNTHKIEYRMQDCWDKDVLDCRRTLKSIADFVANLPEDTINKLIENNIEYIEFSSEYDDPLLADKNYYRNKMDSNGNVVDIDTCSATIISPSFATPKREYKKEQNITRDDGYNINIVDKENNSAEMKITLPNNKQVSLNIEGTNYDTEGDKFHQWQIPKLVDMLKNLPESVLEDLSNEISGIKFMKEGSGNGVYALGSNVIGFTADYDYDTPTISFVHELGHAIDNQNGTMISETPEFANKFEEFKTLLSKFVSVDKNHAMILPAEFFASTYAYKQLPNDSSLNNWIALIDNEVADFKNSEEPDKIKCYQLFEELISDVSNLVNQTRNKSSAQRADNSIALLVKQECGEIINKFKDSLFSNDMLGNSVELELIQALSLDDDGFNRHIKNWESYANDERYLYDIHVTTPKEEQELFAELIEKAKELRARIKQ